jgi:hypothetical protein
LLTRSRNLHIKAEVQNQADVYKGEIIFFGQESPKYRAFSIVIRRFACIVLTAEVSKKHAVAHFIYEGIGRNVGTCQCSR